MKRSFGHLKGESMLILECTSAFSLFLYFFLSFFISFFFFFMGIISGVGWSCN